LKAFRFRCRRTEIVANGVERLDDKSFERDSHAGFATARRYLDPYVLFLGRINWKKGLDRLIPAMEYVPGARLLIAGNDEENYRSKLEVLARRLGVIDRIHFLRSMVRENGSCWNQPGFLRCHRTPKTSGTLFWRRWPSDAL
jgi:glycosyltransferase involved in cell wall biosynthesis